MNNAGIQVSVRNADKVVCIKITGRANFSASATFKSAVSQLCETGHHRFTLDLTDCLLMDSTFAGILAGLGRQFQPAPGQTCQNAIEILNPSTRVADLLDNLGITSLFEISQGPPPDPATLAEIELSNNPPPNQNALSQVCLDAHKNLMQVNPENVPKFKDVTRMLEEEIKRHQEKNS